VIEALHSGSPALLIEKARKDYGGSAGGRREAVVDVSLSVTPGSIHGLLGPNGAGKTTTLKMLLGLVRPSAGSFSILGRDAHEPGARRRLGFLPEQPYFPIQLTAREALSLYGRLGGLTGQEIDEQGKRLLEQVGLVGQERTPLSRFSRGMLQRLGLAQAMLGRPAVIVLDEPASGLDPVGQRDVRNLMLELRESGTTILLSSHQLSEVEAVCDEVTILNQGTVAARGHIDDLLSVAGELTVVARGSGQVPETVAGYAVETDSVAGRVLLSVLDTDVRPVIDALDDAGWRVESLQPRRDSLEDYFTRMLDHAQGRVD
jgi:ABC-2 type transport system ATP-binding protein